MIFMYSRSLRYTCLCCAVHYEGTLAETGGVFDTTHEDNTVFSFELGKGTVIKAWDIALKTMKVNLFLQLYLAISFLVKVESSCYMFFYVVSSRLGRLQKSLASQSTHTELLVLHQISLQSNIFTILSPVIVRTQAKFNYSV